MPYLGVNIYWEMTRSPDMRWYLTFLQIESLIFRQESLNFNKIFIYFGYLGIFSSKRQEFPLFAAYWNKSKWVMIDISAIHKNFRGQCPRVRAFSHVWSIHVIAYVTFWPFPCLSLTVKKIPFHVLYLNFNLLFQYYHQTLNRHPQIKQQHFFFLIYSKLFLTIDKNRCSFKW